MSNSRLFQRNMLTVSIYKPQYPHRANRPTMLNLVSTLCSPSVHISSIYGEMGIFSFFTVWNIGFVQIFMTIEFNDLVFFREFYRSKCRCWVCREECLQKRIFSLSSCNNVSMWSSKHDSLFHSLCFAHNNEGEERFW